jgi:hypothetical protein
VALEVDIALICASAPVLKPLFRRYFNSSTRSTSSLNLPKRRSEIQRADHLETGLSFQDSFQVPVELGPVDHRKISGETHKPLPNLPMRDNTFVARKDDNSEESVFVIQQVEIDEIKPSKPGKNRLRNGERCQRLNDLWARKEPWSGV